MRAAATVLVVEDNHEMRQSLVWLLEGAGYQVEAYADPDDLLNHYQPHRPGCLVIDLRLPGMNGLELWRALRQQGCRHPFLMISGHGDVTVAVQCMHEGAVDFIEKPFDRRHFLNRVQQSLELDAANRLHQEKQLDVRQRIDSLTSREHEVMELVAAGMLTKRIARTLGISEKTVEVHRSHVTRKMRVESVAQLVRLMTEYSHGEHDEVGAEAG